MESGMKPPVVDGTCTDNDAIRIAISVGGFSVLDNYLQVLVRLGSYLILVDFTGRLFHGGKAVISAELAGILERLGSSAESWWARIEKLSKGRLLGRFFAASRERLREVAVRLALHHLPNLGGCPAR